MRMHFNTLFKNQRKFDITQCKIRKPGNISCFVNLFVLVLVFEVTHDNCLKNSALSSQMPVLLPESFY